MYVRPCSRVKPSLHECAAGRFRLKSTRLPRRHGHAGVRKREVEEMAPMATYIQADRPLLKAALDPLGFRVETFNALSACVVVGVMIDSLGRAKAESVEILESPDGRLNAAAKLFVIKSKYRPGRVQGRIAELPIRVPVSFHLRNGQL